MNLKNADLAVAVSKALIYATSLFGTSQGGMMVEISEQDHWWTELKHLP